MTPIKTRPVNVVFAVSERHALCRDPALGERPADTGRPVWRHPALTTDGFGARGDENATRLASHPRVGEALPRRPRPVPGPDA